MTGEEYFTMYLENKERIEKNLRKLGIYDEDLVEETMVDLHEWLQTNKMEKNFVGLFTEFYQTRLKRKAKHDEHYVPSDYETLVKLSDGEQGSDERENAHRVAEQVDAIREFVKTHTFSGERCPETARRIFEMWLQGYTYSEIADAVCSDKGTVRKYLCRMKENLKKHL